MKRAALLIVLIFLLPLFGSFYSLSSVVRVKNSFVFTDVFGEKRLHGNTCSGIVVSDRLVLTVAHVFDDLPNMTSLVVILPSGKELPAKVEKLDRVLDLALLSVEEFPESVKAIKLANSIPALGEDIYFIGFPKASFPNQRFVKFTVHEKLGILVMPVYYGDSGGGIFNMRGELIGIIQNLLLVKEGTEYYMTFVGYGLPIGQIREFLSR